MERGMADNWQQHVVNNMLPRMQANSAAATGLTPGPVETVVAQPPMSFGFPSTPNFDQIEALPLTAAEKLRALRQRAADAHAVIPEFETVRQASMDKITAQNELSRLTDHPADFGFALQPDDPRVVAAQRTLNKATDDLKRLQELREVRTAAWQAASAALATCEGYLRHNVPGNCALEVFEAPEPQLRKGESLLDGVERLRHRGRELGADLHRVRSACYTKAEAMALVSATVENWGSNGIDTSATIEHLSQPTIPTKTVQAMVQNVPGAPGAVVFVDVPDVAAILSTVLKEQFMAWLAADVDRNADPKGALSHEERQQREAEVQADLLAVEREESFFVWQAQQAQALPVEHRGDCSPQAILGVALRTPPRADGLPPTSAGLSWTVRR
jgi:hypothetical protein